MQNVLSLRAVVMILANVVVFLSVFDTFCISTQKTN